MLKIFIKQFKLKLFDNGFFFINFYVECHSEPSLRHIPA